MGRAQSKKRKDEQRFKQYFGEESMEFRNARFFCFCNCKFDPKKQESVEVGFEFATNGREKIFRKRK